MSDSEVKDPYGNPVEEDKEACAIKFIYDGLTNVPKIKVERTNNREIDYLSLYAYAASEVIFENHNRVTEILEQYIGDERFQSKYVH